MTKRIFTKVLAVAIVIVMMLSVCAPIASAASQNRNYDSNGDETISYVALGASNTNGFGLMGYLPDELYYNPVYKFEGSVYGYQSKAEASYPVLVQNALAELTGKTVELDQLAISSMRAEELHVLLDNEYYGDKYTEWRFTDGANWFNMAHPEGLDGLRDEYQNYVANADVITVDIGANNFGVYASNRIFNNMFDNDFTRFDEGTQNSIATVKAMINAVVDEYLAGALTPELSGTLDLIIDTMTYALVGFCVNFDASMERIYELNPDATVVVVNIQNLMHDLYATLPGMDEPFAFGEFYGAIVNMANLYVATMSPYADKYNYAYIGEDGQAETFLKDIQDYTGDPKDLRSAVTDCFDVYDNSMYAKTRVLQAWVTQYDAYVTAADGYNESDWSDLEKFSTAVYNDAILIAGTPINDFLAVGKKGTLPTELQSLYDMYELALLTVYDTAATFMQLGANSTVLDLAAAAADFGTVGEQVLNQLFAMLIESMQNPGLKVEETDEFKALANDSTAMAIITIGVRSYLGNSFFSHPNENGHVEIKDAIINALENDIKGKDEALCFDYTVSEDSYYLAIGRFDTLEETYAELLAEKLGEINAMAFDITDRRVSDLRALLDVTYENDAYGAKLEEINAEIREAVIAEIAAADLITVDFGTADFTTFAMNQIIGKLVADLDEVKSIVDILLPGYFDNYKTYEMDWTRFEEFNENVDVASVLVDVRAELVTAGIPETQEVPLGDTGLTVEIELADLMTYAVETYLYASVNYVYNYVATIEAIHAINPDAEVVLLGAYNLLEGLTFELQEGVVTDLTGLGEIMTNVLNAQAFACAVMIPNTTYVGIEDARADAESIELDKIIGFDAETLEIYVNIEAIDATAAGHAYIAEKILAAMTITCEHIYGGCEDDDCNYCGELRVAGKHVYDNCEDTYCNVCGEKREALEHKFVGCTDTTCENCDATREAGEHEYDEDCTDTTCNKCGEIRVAETEHKYDGCEDTACNNPGCEVTRKAGEHVYDGCLDTTCNNCSNVRIGRDHVYEDCVDSTCEECGYRRVAVGHVYDNDCTDTTCNTCGEIRVAETAHKYDNDCQDTTCNNAGCEVTRAAAEHVYEDCADTTCANCAVTRVAGHVYDDCTDTTCANCAATRAAAEHVYEDCEDITCANCSRTRVAPGHTFGDWTTTKAPTFDEAGEKQRTCSVCGKVETEAIAKLVADDDDNDETTAPETEAETTTEAVDDDGEDEENGLSAGAIAGISIAAVVVVGVGGFAIYWFVIKKKTWAEFLAIFKKKN